MKQISLDNNLWKCRKISGLTQRDITYRLGIKDISQISRWEKGERVPSLENCFKLAEIYKCGARNLFFDLYNEAQRSVQLRMNSIKEKKSEEDSVYKQ